MSRFLPSSFLPKAVNLPPVFPLILAGAPVERVCFRESRYLSKRDCGAVRNRTLCWMTGVILPPTRTGKVLFSEALEQVAHLVLLRLHVGAGNFGDARLARNALEHAHARGFELPDFVRIVGEQANLRGTELFEDSGGKIVFARIRSKTERN